MRKDEKQRKEQLALSPKAPPKTLVQKKERSRPPKEMRGQTYRILGRAFFSHWSECSSLLNILSLYSLQMHQTSKRGANLNICLYCLTTYLPCHPNRSSLTDNENMQGMPNRDHKRSHSNKVFAWPIKYNINSKLVTIQFSQKKAIKWHLLKDIWFMIIEYILQLEINGINFEL